MSSTCWATFLGSVPAIVAAVAAAIASIQANRTSQAVHQAVTAAPPSPVKEASLTECCQTVAWLIPG